MDDMAWDALAQNANNPNFGDEKLLVQFSLQPVKDDEQTLAEGRPVYRDVEFIRIRIPGDRTGEINRPIRDGDKERFARAYAHWKLTGQTDGVVGTPLVTWPQVTRSQVEELAYFNVKTVEALANMADVHVTKHLSFRPLRDKARQFILDAKEKAPMEALHAAIAEKDNQIATLQAAIEDLKGQMQELRKKK